MSDKDLPTDARRCFSPLCSVRSNVTPRTAHCANLPCGTSSYHHPNVLEQTRRDMLQQYVYLFRDGHLDPGNQNPYFRNRTLRDIRLSDGGLHECRFKEGDTRHRNRFVLRNDPISAVYLTADKIQYITARCGHNIILPCRVSRDTTVDALEWTRSDLESEGYVFLLRYGIPDTANQHPSFKNRVELSNSLLSDGNLSLILKNVSSSDAGRYECRLKDSDARLYKRAINKLIRREPISIIELTVTESELADEDAGDKRDTEDEEDTIRKQNKKNPDVGIPINRASRDGSGLIACCVGCLLLYAFIMLWAFI